MKMSPDDGLFESGGGSATMEETIESAATEIDSGRVGGEEGGPPPSTPAPKPTDDIARAIEEGFRSVAAQQPQAPQPQLTEAEIARLLKVWQPDESFAQEMRDAIASEDPKAVHKVVLAMRDGMMTQSSTYVNYMTQMLREELMKEFGPALQVVRQQRQQQTVGRFVDRYPQLKPFTKIIPVVAQQLQATGRSYQTDDEAFDAMAAAMTDHIKTINPQFSLGAPATAGGGGVKPASVMLGGGGGGGSPKPTKSSADIWD